MLNVTWLQYHRSMSTKSPFSKLHDKQDIYTCKFGTIILISNKKKLCFDIDQTNINILLAQFKYRFE